MKGDKEDYFLVKNRNLSLSNSFAPLAGLEEDLFYFEDFYKLYNSDYNCNNNKQ